MEKIRVTKQFNFEMGHALWNYDGACKNLHGHSYILFVTVIGSIIKDENNVKLGMVIDFSDLKKIVNSEIIDKFDHAIAISEKAPHQQLTPIDQMFKKIVITPYQPTCENMVSHFAQLIKAKLPAGVELFSVKLHETANSFAEWFAADNA